MKSKKFTYVLMVSVAAVWGIIFYKLFTVDDTDQAVPSVHQAATHELSVDYKLQDTFSLMLNYRDPFSGKLLKQEDAVPRPVNENMEPVIIAKPVLSGEQVRYSGYIVNPSTKKNVSILIVMGREQMMSDGEVFGDIRLIKNLKDSVKVSFQGHTYFIRKTN